jgi:hypothetical protein
MKSKETVERESDRAYDAVCASILNIIDEMAGRAAAWEARVIRSSLEASVSDRLKALTAAEAAPRVKNKRL